MQKLYTSTLIAESPEAQPLMGGNSAFIDTITQGACTTFTPFGKTRLQRNKILQGFTIVALLCFAACSMHKNTSRNSGHETETDQPDAMMQWEYNRVKNPVTGEVHNENLVTVYSQFLQKQRNIYTAVSGSAIQWTERGPNNIGGRTRAIIFDKKDTSYKTVFAASVGGGLFKCTDIDTATPTWNKVNDFFSNIAITCIAQNPTHPDTVYFGTGEGFGNGDALKGAGVWRSTDGGSSWNQLASSMNGTVPSYITRLAINSYGVIYASTSNGLFKSVDGSSWNAAVTTGTSPSASSNSGKDVKIAANNDVYYSCNSQVWKYAYSTSAWSNVTPSGSFQRIEIATAASNSSYVYLLCQGSSSAVTGFFSSSNAAGSFTSRTVPKIYDQNATASTEISRNQAWYDLSIAVDPNTATTVYVGAIDYIKSTDAGATYKQISAWSLYAMPGAANLGTSQVMHSDHHVLTFKPGSSSYALFGCDGGIYKSTNMTNVWTAVPSYTAINTNYNVTQFYSCAIANVVGSNNFLAGAQDNGSLKFTETGVNSVTTVSGGDGCFVYIDQNDSNNQITSYVYNNYYVSTDASTFNTLSGSNSTGDFVNPGDLDGVNDILYTKGGSGILSRWTDVFGSVSRTNLTLTGVSGISHIKVSPNNAKTIYIGTTSGKVYKIANANTATSPITPTLLNSSSFGARISCIEIRKCVAATDDTILVTQSSYGASNSVIITTNSLAATPTWTNIDDNNTLPDIPVNWCLFAPTSLSKEVLLATDMGIYTCDDVYAATPVWGQSNTGFANVRVDMLKYRTSDSLIAAATHGRGLFTTDKYHRPSPVAAFSVNSQQVCINQSVDFTDNSTSNPTSWFWTITPSSYSYVGGTTANSQNPKVQFTAQGVSYSLTLTVSNPYGTDSITKTNYIITNAAITNDTIGGTQTICAGGTPLMFNGSIPAGGTAVFVGTKISEDFNGALVPSGWNLVLNQSSLLGADTSINSYGRSGTLGAIRAENYNTSAGNRAELNTDTFSATITPELLHFDVAHAGYDTGYTDSLIIYTSNGSVFNKLIAWASSQSLDTVSGITTAVPTTAFFVPTASQWITKNITLPVGTTQVKFAFYSDFGNQIYIDRVRIDSFVIPITFLWQKSTASSTLGFNSASGTNNTKNYTSSSLSQNTWFRRVVTSGACTSDTSSAIAITVNSLPSAKVGSTVTICSGDTIAIGATTVNGSTYLWTSLPIGFSDTLSQPKIHPTVTTTYTLTETIKATGCYKSDSVSITVKPLPSATVGSAKSICNGDSVYIGASKASGNTYSWTSSPSGFSDTLSQPKVHPASTTTYTLTETVTATGCYKSNSVIITVNPVPSAKVGSNKTICKGGTTSIGATAVSGNTYSWTSSPSGFTSTSNNPSVSPATTTIYYLTETITTTGCTKMDSVTVSINPLPSANVGSNKTICKGANTSIGSNTVNGNSYSWTSKPNGFTDTTSNPTVNPIITTIYYLTETVRATTCSKIDSVNVTVNQKTSATLTKSACYNYTFNGQTLTTSGVYYDTLTNSVSCDSIITLNLIINQASDDSLNVTVCNSYIFNGNTLSSSGKYYDTVANAKGCDSIITLNLTINQSSATTITKTACNSYMFFGNTFTNSGTYFDTLTNSVSCDSIVTLKLSIIKSTTNTITATACNSYTFKGNSITTSGVYYDTLTNSVGCDSTVTLNLTINNSTTNTITITACNSYMFFGNTITNSGTYFDTLKNSVNCDSIVTLKLSVNKSTTNTITATACNSYTFKGNSITISGVYYDTLTNSVGCDSTVTLNLTINNSTTNTITTTACNSYIFNGNTLSSSGIYYDTVANAKGCDSIVTLNLTVNSLPTVTANSTAATVCAGSSVTLTGGGAISYSWSGGVTDGVSFSPSSTSSYTVIGTDSNKCINTAIIKITVNPLPNSKFNFSHVNVSANVNFIANFNGLPAYQWDFGDGSTDTGKIASHLYNGTGTYIACLTTTNIFGCKDSTCQTINTNTEILNPDFNNPIKIYPNPTSSKLTIEYKSYIKQDVIIYNALGDAIYKDLLPPSQTLFNIDMSYFAKGIYFVRLGNQLVKVVKD